MTLYRALLGIDLAAAAVALFFFLWGLTDGTALYAPGAWFLLLGGIAVVIGGGIALRRVGRPGLASVVLSLIAIPTIGYVLFFGLLILTNPRWN